MKAEPCKQAADELREAINEWVEASEATRDFMVTNPWDFADEQDTLPPEYFGRMQQAFEREKDARSRYVKANNDLLECMHKHGLID